MLFHSHKSHFNSVVVVVNVTIGSAIMGIKINQTLGSHSQCVGSFVSLLMNCSFTDHCSSSGTLSSVVNTNARTQWIQSH